MNINAKILISKVVPHCITSLIAAAYDMNEVVRSCATIFQGQTDCSSLLSITETENRCIAILMRFINVNYDIFSNHFFVIKSSYI